MVRAPASQVSEARPGAPASVVSDVSGGGTSTCFPGLRSETWGTHFCGEWELVGVGFDYLGLLQLEVVEAALQLPLLAGLLTSLQEV